MHAAPGARAPAASAATTASAVASAAGTAARTAAAGHGGLQASRSAPPPARGKETVSKRRRRG
eukprot:648139-Prymnesium_polylepis.1